MLRDRSVHADLLFGAVHAYFRRLDLAQLCVNALLGAGWWGGARYCSTSLPIAQSPCDKDGIIVRGGRLPWSIEGVVFHVAPIVVLFSLGACRCNILAASQAESRQCNWMARLYTPTHGHSHARSMDVYAVIASGAKQQKKGSKNSCKEFRCGPIFFRSSDRLAGQISVMIDTCHTRHLRDKCLVCQVDGISDNVNTGCNTQKKAKLK